MRVRFKKVDSYAVAPHYASEGDACLDLYAVSSEIDEFENLTYDTGIAFEIPEGYVGLLFPRSSITKTNLMLKNSVGVIDSGYRGTVKVKFHIDKLSKHSPYMIGDRVAQMMIVPRPHIQLEAVDNLSETIRGTGGFGSTGS